MQGGKSPYVYVDGIYLRRNWGGEYENVAILVAIAVNEDGYREVLGAAEGMKEDKASWVGFFQWLKSRGLDGVKLIVGDKCQGMLEAVGEVFPDAKYQRCTVHFYRNVFSVVPRFRVKHVAKMLKAIHAQESKKAAREKARAVIAELREMKLKEAAKKVDDGIEETLTYCDFPPEHWTRIRTNNVMERLNREIGRRTRVVGTFPDGNSAQSQILCKLPTRREQIRIQCVRQRIYPTAACVQYNAGGDGCQGRRQGRRSSERRAAARRPLTSGPGGVIRACVRQSRWTAARGSRSSPAAVPSTSS